MLMRRVLSAGVVLVCIALLSSCSLLPPGPGGAFVNDPSKQADAQMQRIADAVKDHDAAALKKLFSKTAREKATNLDSGLKYFLSVFPSGLKSWTEPDGAPGQTGNYDGGKRTVVLFGNYKVAANGKKYELYFADYTVNQVDDPNNVGIYALGVVPSRDSGYTASGAKKPFNAWASQFGIKNHTATGDPGVYVPQK